MASQSSAGAADLAQAAPSSPAGPAVTSGAAAATGAATASTPALPPASSSKKRPRSTSDSVAKATVDVQRKRQRYAGGATTLSDDSDDAATPPSSRDTPAQPRQAQRVRFRGPHTPAAYAARLLVPGVVADTPNSQAPGVQGTASGDWRTPPTQAWISTPATSSTKAKAIAAAAAASSAKSSSTRGSTDWRTPPTQPWATTPATSTTTATPKSAPKSALSKASSSSAAAKRSQRRRVRIVEPAQPIVDLTADTPTPPPKDTADVARSLFTPPVAAPQGSGANAATKRVWYRYRQAPPSVRSLTPLERLELPEQQVGGTQAALCMRASKKRLGVLMVLMLLVHKQHTEPFFSNRVDVPGRATVYGGIEFKVTCPRVAAALPRFNTTPSRERWHQWRATNKDSLAASPTPAASSASASDLVSTPFHQRMRQRSRSADAGMPMHLALPAPSAPQPAVAGPGLNPVARVASHKCQRHDPHPCSRAWLLPTTAPPHPRVTRAWLAARKARKQGSSTAAAAAQAQPQAATQAEPTAVAKASAPKAAPVRFDGNTGRLLLSTPMSMAPSTESSGGYQGCNALVYCNEAATHARVSIGVRQVLLGAT